MAELDPGGRSSLPVAEELFEKHQGNLRTALLEAYDLRASQIPTA
jgi:hypothetical protein